jgi:Cu2+-exporting ATPase
VIGGRGLEAEIEGQRWRLGQAEFAAPGQASEQKAIGDTEIWLSDENGWVAGMELSDKLREGAAAAISELLEEGLDISILSGDSAAAVGPIARMVGIETWSARQSPAAKLEAIQKMKTQAHRVLMVGDGVNDAPVLAAADVSMTVKGGSELANSVADMILTGDSLGLVNHAREIARRARSLIRQNLAWALLYNASVLPLAISGLLQPWMAALGMSLSSLLVVANATRLVKQRDSAEDSERAAQAGALST